MTERRHTRQRDTIFNTLERAEGPLSARDIFERARATLPGLGLATVYRTVALLRQDGRINEVNLPGDEPRFEATRRGHHHHLQCTSCGKVLELDYCPVRLETGAVLENGFRVQGHHLTLYGLCAQCGV